MRAPFERQFAKDSRGPADRWATTRRSRCRICQPAACAGASHAAVGVLQIHRAHADQVTKFFRDHLGAMPAQAAHDDVDRQQIVEPLHVDLFGREELQREQVQHPHQQIRLGFGKQLVVRQAVGVADIPDIGAGGRGC